MKCSYCANEVEDSSNTDKLGELVLKRPLPICNECVAFFELEPFDYQDWKK